MANYGSMVLWESWWNVILRIPDPVIRDDRARRLMEYGFHHHRDLEGLDVDAKAFMEEIFNKMDEMNGNREEKINKVQKYDYVQLGVWDKYLEGRSMKEIARETEIPYDSVRKWINNRKKEGYTGKDFPISSNQVPESLKNFPINKDYVPESRLSDMTRDIPEKKKLSDEWSRGF